MGWSSIFLWFSAVTLLQGCEGQSDGAPTDGAPKNAAQADVDRSFCKDIAEQKLSRLDEKPSIYLPADQEIVDVIPIACGGKVRLAIRRNSVADFTKLEKLYLGIFDSTHREERAVVVARVSGKIYYFNGTASIGVTRVSDEKVLPRPF